MIKIENLVYKEDENAKCFISENFNFILSKDEYTSMSWGKTHQDSPLYNPISPETIIFKVDKDYLFNRDLIFKLINLNIKNDKESSSVSCITNIIIEGSFEEIINNEDVKKLIQYLNSFNILCFLNIDFTNELSLKDVFKFKYLGISNIILNLNNFKNDSLINSINLLLDNNILTNCNFNINSKNIENIIDLFSNEKYSVYILSNLILQKPNIKKVQFEKLSNVIKERSLLNVSIKKSFNDRKKYIVKSSSYEAGLFCCIVDFITNKIYCDDIFIDNFVNIDSVKNLSDYWNSEQFNNVRKQLIKDF